MLQSKKLSLALAIMGAIAVPGVGAHKDLGSSDKAGAMEVPPPCRPSEMDRPKYAEFLQLGSNQHSVKSSEDLVHQLRASTRACTRNYKAKLVELVSESLLFAMLIGESG
jgi:hypothetical protein